MPAVARLGDSCTGHSCFPPRSNNEASSDVFVNNLGAHRVGDGYPSHCCFTSDTKFLINNEYKTFKDVYDNYHLYKNSKTLSFDISNNKFVEVDIAQIIKAKTDNIIELTLSNGNIIKCTLDHEILLVDGTYKQAQFLTHNDDIRVYKGVFMKIINKKIINKEQFVYCIEVSNKNHNFILENNLVVSNCGPTCHSSALAQGSSTVFVNSRPLGRISDSLDCGSTVMQGSGNVFAN